MGCYKYQSIPNTSSYAFTTVLMNSNNGQFDKKNRDKDLSKSH